MADDDFQPRLGRMRGRGKAKQARKFLSRVIAAVNLARGGAARMGRARSGFTGSRAGRGAGAGQTMAGRDLYAAFRQRRVIVKARIVALRGKGMDTAKAHLRYVERDGTNRDGGRGALYGPESDRVDRREWLDKASGDRHQFRFIVSAEDGAEYDDLKTLTRRLMARVEEDLGTRLDWVAVDHHNTGHPHTHIIVRGKDASGKDLIIARDYISHGFRERAAELVDLDLGPRSDQDIARRLRAEIDQERLTSIDRALLRESETDLIVSSEARGAFGQALRTGRLRALSRLGLASQLGASSWRLAPDTEAVLRHMGERGDIIRTMQRTYVGEERGPAQVDMIIYEPRCAALPLIGRIRARGLSDEHRDRHYMIVEAADGRSHYVELGKLAVEMGQGAGSIVEVRPAAGGIRQADRTIATVAAANGGVYTVDAHLRYDRGASETFAAAHVRRLEAMRRAGGVCGRDADGSWRIADDHLDRVEAYEVARARDRPVTVQTLAKLSLDEMVSADAATWLDRELVAADPLPLRDAGFGREVKEAQARRGRWLVAQGLAALGDGGVTCRPDLVAVLRRRELLRIADEIVGQSGKTFVEMKAGARLEGRLARRIDLVSGSHALVERSRDFTLVPWQPILESRIGKPVGGIVRESGIAWSFGRGRSAPGVE